MRKKQRQRRQRDEETYVPPYMREFIRRTTPIVEEAVRRAMKTGESIDDLLGLSRATRSSAKR